VRTKKPDSGRYRRYGGMFKGLAVLAVLIPRYALAAYADHCKATPTSMESNAERQGGLRCRFWVLQSRLTRWRRMTLKLLLDRLYAALQCRRAATSASARAPGVRVHWRKPWAEFQHAVEIDSSSFLAQQELRRAADLIRRQERLSRGAQGRAASQRGRGVWPSGRNCFRLSNRSRLPCTS